MPATSSCPRKKALARDERQHRALRQRKSSARGAQPHAEEGSRRRRRQTRQASLRRPASGGRNGHARIGSVWTRDIADAVSAGGVSLSRDQVSLDKPIKALGLHDLKVILHPKSASPVTLNVARTAEEAERQARGENVLKTEAEQARIDAEALFESDEAAAGLKGDDEEAEAPPQSRSRSARKGGRRTEGRSRRRSCGRKPAKKAKKKKEE